MHRINLTNLLVEAASLGDDVAVAQILTEISLEDACKWESRTKSSNFGCNALHKAKTLAVAQLLLNFGLDVNSRGNKEQTPLHTSCDNPPVMSVLLEHGAKLLLTVDGSTALEWAVVADSVECAKLLISHFCEAVNMKNHNGNTPLHLVVSKKMTELLLKNGARVSAENNRNQIPLESATERIGDSDYTAITELLLDVSEERGLKYRSSRSLVSNNSAGSMGTSNDQERGLPDDGSGGSGEGWEGKKKADRSKLRGGRWNFVKEHFMNKTQQGSDASVAPIRPRLGSMLSEWNEGANNFVSLRTIIRDNSSNSNMAQCTDSTPTAAAHVDDPLINFFESEDEEEDEDEEEEEEEEHNDFYRTFFEMSIVERPHLALRILDRHRTFLYAKGSSRMYMYDFSLLGGIDKSSFALRLMVENDRKDLVAHDLCQWLLHAKWILFSSTQLVEEGLFYLVFIALFVLYTLFDQSMPYRLVTQFLVLVLALRFVMRFYFEAKHRMGNGEVGVWGAIFRGEKFTGSVFFIAPMCIVLNWFTPIDTQVFEALASVMLWVRVLYFLEAFNETTGLAMRIVRTMVMDISVYVMVQIIFLVAFAHAMTIAFRSSKDPPSEFATFQASFTTLLFFIFNLDATSVYNEPDFYTRLKAMILLAFFESLVVVMFLNLVIAVMSSSFERVMSEAKEEWLLVRAKICIRMEDQMMVNFGSSLAKRKLNGHKAFWTKQRKFTVKERADGQNVIALPVEMLPEESWVTWLARSAVCHRWMDDLSSAAAVKSKDQRTANSLNDYGSIQRERRRKKGKDMDKPVQIGVFERTSKSTSASTNLMFLGEELSQLSDEKLMESVKGIMGEMERRRTAAAAED